MDPRIGRILVVLAANALFATAAHAGFEGEDHTNATLLISTSGEDMRAAANALARHGTANQALLDLAANMLWLGCKGQRGIPSDAQVALGAALGQSGRIRYRDVLTYCADRALHSDVKDGTEEALALLPDDNTNNEIQFIGGSIRLYDVSTQLAASISRDAAKRPAQLLAEVGAGQSIEAVYQRIGLPDSVAAEGEGIIAHYGEGAVPFTPSSEEGWRIPGAAAPAKHAPVAAPKPPVATPAPQPPVVTAAPAPTPPPVAPAPVPAPAPAPKPQAATPAPMPTPVPAPTPAPTPPPAAAAPPPPPPVQPVPVLVPAPAPVAVPSPPPVEAAPPAPVATAPANSAFQVGQVAHLRMGAQVRARPMADSKVAWAAVKDPLTLKSPMTNTTGVWWFVEYQTKSGWVFEGDLAP